MDGGVGVGFGFGEDDGVPGAADFVVEFFQHGEGVGGLGEDEFPWERLVIAAPLADELGGIEALVGGAGEGGVGELERAGTAGDAGFTPGFTPGFTGKPALTSAPAILRSSVRTMEDPGAMPGRPDSPGTY